MKAGDIVNAEATLDRILGIVRRQADVPGAAARGSKLSGLRQRIDEWLAAVGDPGAVMPLGQKLELLERGTPEEIDGSPGSKRSSRPRRRP